MLRLRSPTSTFDVLPPPQLVISSDCPDTAPAKAEPPAAPKMPRGAVRIDMPPASACVGQTVVMSLALSLPKGAKLTDEAPSCWVLSAEGQTRVSFAVYCWACAADLAHPRDTRPIAPSRIDVSSRSFPCNGADS